MKVNFQVNTIAYKSVSPKKTADVNNGHISLKRMLAEADRENSWNGSTLNMSGNNVINSALSYSRQLKEQRESARDTSLEKKKLRYQFKDISSQIIRSKTSQSARRAVSSARRELLRLKQEKQSGKYESEEIDAAITHAKAMERVARKKVKHLEEEELLKAAGGVCADYATEQEKDPEENETDSAYNSEMEKSDETLGEMSVSNTDIVAEKELMMSMPAVETDLMEDISDLEADLMQDMEEGMQDMLEMMGLDEMSDSLTAAKGDIDPEDFKMMKIKHRNKEMKEMTEADSEYLKAVFKYLEKMKSGGAMPTGNTSGAAFDSKSAANIGISGLPGVSGAGDFSGIAGMSGMGTSVIDISL